MDKLLKYKRSWIQHVNRMPRNRLPRVMKLYCPSGRGNRGRCLKRLLDTWDQNGSTSGLTPWKIYDDDWVSVLHVDQYCTGVLKHVENKVKPLRWRQRVRKGRFLLRSSHGREIVPMIQDHLGTKYEIKIFF